MTSPADSHGHLKMATLTVPDLERFERAWVDYLDYRVRRRAVIEADLAETWAAPQMAGRPCLILGPASGYDVFVRAIEGDEVEADVQRSLGWAALELTVRDATALCAVLDDSDFDILEEPEAMGAIDAVSPLRVAGPAGEVLHLHEVRGRLDGRLQPHARSDIEHVFTAVLAAPDLDGAAAFYVRGLGFDRGCTRRIPHSIVNDTFDLEESWPLPFATLGVRRQTVLEIVEYPSLASLRTTSAGCLPPATAMVSFLVDDLGEIDLPFLCPPSMRHELPYAGRLVAVCRGAAGELVELIALHGAHS